MCKGKAGVATGLMVLLLAPALLLAQAGQNAPAPGAGPGPRGRRGEEPPCFKQAGVSDATWRQILGIRKSTHQKVVGICENTSLKPSQQRQQIREARQQAEQQVHGLLTPQQQDAVKQCRKQRRAGRGERMGRMRGMRRRGGGNPCAWILRQQNRRQGGPPPASEPPQE